MRKKITFLFAVLTLSLVSFGQDKGNALVGNHSFVLADEGLKELAKSVNDAYLVLKAETTTRALALEAQSNYDKALANYLEGLEKLVVAEDAKINEDLQAEIKLVKDLQMQRNAQKNR